jgi:NADPH-dependent 2,4-dienoyl-CoA reductase/sulfur reductase-like enzyme
VTGVTERMVVVGADAAGMSAASQARRLRGDKLEVVAFERGDHSSYSACGIPYWVAGDVVDGEQLVARTPAAHRANGIDLRMLIEVEGIDLQAGRVAVRDLASGRTVLAGLGPHPGRRRPGLGSRPRRPLSRTEAHNRPPRRQLAGRPGFQLAGQELGLAVTTPTRLARMVAAAPGRRSDARASRR